MVQNKRLTWVITTYKWMISPCQLWFVGENLTTPPLGEIFLYILGWSNAQMLNIWPIYQKNWVVLGYECRYLEPKWPVFWLEKALFGGGLTFKNRGHWGSRSIYHTLSIWDEDADIWVLDGQDFPTRVGRHEKWSTKITQGGPPKPVIS